jgi:hypothetical protein
MSVATRIMSMTEVTVMGALGIKGSVTVGIIDARTYHYPAPDEGRYGQQIQSGRSSLLILIV